MTDTVLVRAPVGVVYRTLTDLDAWPLWHTGCRSRRQDGRPGSDVPPFPGQVDRHSLRLPRPRRTPGGGVWRLEVSVHGWRHDVGVSWDVCGDVELAAEWWLEPWSDGTLLHHLVQQAPSEGRRVARHRQAIRATMQSMKDHLELAVGLASGRVP